MKIYKEAYYYQEVCLYSYKSSYVILKYLSIKETQFSHNFMIIKFMMRSLNHKNRPKVLLLNVYLLRLKY